MDERIGRRREPEGMGRHILGLGVLLIAIVPAYVAFRVPLPDALVAFVEADIRETDEPEIPEISMAEIQAHIREVASRYGVSPRLVAAIVEAESEFNPRAESRKGARGLMQLMPATATSLQVEDAFDPRSNIDGGVRHLRRLLDRFDGDLPIVLAAYNAGEQAVIQHRGVPPYRETRRYVRRILRRIGHPSVVTAPARVARSTAVVLVGTRVDRTEPAARAADVDATVVPVRTVGSEAP
ncbi:MAG TPA: lytic transglycosylase domain-containing protein [Candidatus Limnocylindria bacterium]|nr:lytic transglycosylase domain-containing protein [Candidatus Limnocylindria bacterium]